MQGSGGKGGMVGSAGEPDEQTPLVVTFQTFVECVGFA